MAGEEVLLIDDREVVITDAMHVRCDGGSGALGHPVEFMTLEKDGQTVLQILRPPLRAFGHPEVELLRGRSRPFAA